MPYATPFWAKVYLTSNLSNDEEIQAFKDWNENSSWGSRDKIVLSYLKLVQKISRQKRIKLTNVDTEEFFSEGVLGLIRAIQLFDPSKGLKLATYAFFWINAYINKFIQNTRSVVRHINSCKRAGDKASLVLDVSLDCNINDNRSFIDLIPDPQGTQEEIVSSEQELERKRLMLKESLANLKKVERNVIVARYGGERIKTLSSVAHKLGMSTEGVRKTEMRAIQKLKEMMAGREL